MTDFARSATFSDGEVVDAGRHNDNQDVLETFFNDTGVPKVQGDAEVVNTNYSDTQSADITADGVLTGISITPAAGNYLAIATAESLSVTDGSGWILHLRVGGVNVIEGPQVFGPAALIAPLVVMGLLTPSGAQAVEVYGDRSSGTATCRQGRLVLVRLGG